jgi:hypothetical protein
MRPASRRCRVAGRSAIDNGRRSILRLQGFQRAPLCFSGCRLAVARGNQLLLELRPFVGCHDGLIAWRRQIMNREINACFRGQRCLGPRVHQ